MTGYPLAFIVAVKNTPEGAKAFERNRIWPLLFVRAANLLLHSANELPAGFSTWKEFDQMQVALIHKTERLKVERLVMETADARAQSATAMGITFSELERFCRELPPAMAGLPAVEIYKRLTNEVESIRKNLKQKFEGIGK